MGAKGALVNVGGVTQVRTVSREEAGRPSVAVLYPCSEQIPAAKMSRESDFQASYRCLKSLKILQFQCCVFKV